MKHALLLKSYKHEPSELKDLLSLLQTKKNGIAQHDWGELEEVTGVIDLSIEEVTCGRVATE